MKWRWVRADTIFAMHGAQLARHGGLDGINDRNAVESAIARAPSLPGHGEPEPDAAALAASYAYGLSWSHGFSDGNKRIAWLAARLFLADNGVTISFEATDAIRIIVALASGAQSEAELATWFRERLVRSDQLP
jgi:death-on-curing protein